MDTVEILFKVALNTELRAARELKGEVQLRGEVIRGTGENPGEEIQVAAGILGGGSRGEEQIQVEAEDSPDQCEYACGYERGAGVAEI